MACFASSLVLQRDKSDRASSQNDTLLAREPVSPDEFTSTFQTVDTTRPKVSLGLFIKAAENSIEFLITVEKVKVKD